MRTKIPNIHWPIHTQSSPLVPALPALDIILKQEAGNSLIAPVHICCFIITSNPLELDNNRKWTESESPHNNCQPLFSTPTMLFKFMFLLTAYLPHYISMLN